MRRLFLLIGVFVSLLVPVFSTGVYAQDIVKDPACSVSPDSPLCAVGTEDPTTNSIYGPNGLLTKIARLISYAVGVGAVIMVITGGIRYAMSSGDPNNLKGAKDQIIFAFVGLVVSILAQAIVIFVLNNIEG